ncbi:MAG: hypothetical protein VYB98_07295, partial [Actinomycetota bacterium]|nr:hypothetical protein [Actinomycetota bacterium]
MEGTINIDSLTGMPTGDLRDGVSGEISVNQLATLSATSIKLGDSIGNSTNFGRLVFNSAGSVTIGEDSSMMVAGPSTAGGGLALSSTGEMRLDGTIDVTGDTMLSAAGTIEVNAKLNGSGSVLLVATDNIVVDAEMTASTFNLSSDDDVQVRSQVTASDLIDLSAGADGTGGIEITSTGRLETTAAGSDVTLATGADAGDVLLTGSMIALDQVTVTSDAGSVNGSGRITGESVSLNAETGLGSTTLLTTSATNVSAITTSGAIEVENTLVSAVLASSLVTGNGAVDFVQLGGGDLTVGVVSASTLAMIENQAGSVTLDVTLNSDSLSVMATGDLSDGASGEITVNQLATLSAASITLGDSAGNSTNFGRLVFNSTGSVTIGEDSSMTVAGPS